MRWASCAKAGETYAALRTTTIPTTLLIVIRNSTFDTVAP